MHRSSFESTLTCDEALENDDDDDDPYLLLMYLDDMILNSK